MKILLTGATGFLGSSLLMALGDTYTDIVILKRSFSNDIRIAQYLKSYRVYDIDKIRINEIFEKEESIDVVIHCATNYGRKSEKAYEVFQSNVNFPLELLETAALFNTNAFINTDTSLCKVENVKGYMQNYILTKKQFCEWGKLFAGTGKINFINMRLEQIYGAGDDDSKFTSLVVHSCINNVEKLDLTDGKQLRDFVYIKDVISAYKTIIDNIENQIGYQDYEVGFGKAVRIKDFVNIVHQITNSKTKLNFGAIPYRENEILYSEANTIKLNSLGWFPKYKLELGISEYIERIKKITNADMR